MIGEDETLELSAVKILEMNRLHITGGLRHVSLQLRSTVSVFFAGATQNLFLPYPSLGETKVAYVSSMSPAFRCVATAILC